MAETANETDASNQQDEVIAPGGKAGLRNADVLKKAETDDEVYLEFEVEGREGVYGVRSTVANTSETEQDDSKKLIEYSLEACDELVRTLTPQLLTDTGSAYNCILDSVKIEWADDATPDAHVYDVTHVEVEKA